MATQLWAFLLPGPLPANSMNFSCFIPLRGSFPYQIELDGTAAQEHGRELLLEAAAVYDADMVHKSPLSIPTAASLQIRLAIPDNWGRVATWFNTQPLLSIAP